MIRRTVVLCVLALCVGFAATPRDARADLTGDWTVDINWVPLFIDASFDFSMEKVGPNFYSTTLAGDGGWAFRTGPKAVVMGNTNFPGLLYIGTNYDGLDEAVGGWQENTEVPNWGSFHMVRAAPLAPADSASMAGGGLAATGGQE